MPTLISKTPSRAGSGWLDEDFNHLFEGFFRPMRALEESGTTRDLIPAIDVSEDDNQYIVRAELPGVHKDDIGVTLENGVLTISADTKSESEEKKGERVIRQERRYGKYLRTLRLGTQIDEKNVNAAYKDGVLQLVVPKTEAVKPKRITVDIG
ncbi:MAG: Hsp20/alpha crystallin family protein [Gammaproteobacteria bacterium]|nr:Hsp20/alpha crystallin family protein [Gammaproteobacteria bacterium]